MTENERDRMLQCINDTLLRMLALQSMALGVQITAHERALGQPIEDTANELIVSTGRFLAKNLKPTGG